MSIKKARNWLNGLADEIADMATGTADEVMELLAEEARKRIFPARKVAEADKTEKIRSRPKLRKKVKVFSNAWEGKMTLPAYSVSLFRGASDIAKKTGSLPGYRPWILYSLPRLKDGSHAIFSRSNKLLKKYSSPYIWLKTGAPGKFPRFSRYKSVPRESSPSIFEQAKLGKVPIIRTFVSPRRFREYATLNPSYFRQTEKIHKVVRRAFFNVF